MIEERKNGENPPFIYQRPLTSHEFMGRKRELRRLFSRLATGQSTAIIGPHQIGKTSLLNMVVDPQKREQLLGNHFQTDVFQLIELQTVQTIQKPEDFWELVLLTLSRETSQPMADLYQQAISQAFSLHALQRLCDQLAIENRRLILLLDDFDKVLANPALNQASFYGGLRSLVSLSPGIVIVIAMESDVSQLNQGTSSLNPSSSPYFNFVTQINLGGLTEGEFKSLLDLGGAQFTQTDRQFIYDVVGQHPYLAQMAAATLWHKHRITKSHHDYQQISQALYDQAKGYLNTLWQVWTPEMRRLIVCIGFIQLSSMVGKQRVDDQLIHNIADYSFELDKLKQCAVLQENDQTFSIPQQVLLWWLLDELSFATRSKGGLQAWVRHHQLNSVLAYHEIDLLLQTIQGVLSISPSAQYLMERYLKELIFEG